MRQHRLPPTYQIIGLVLYVIRSWPHQKWSTLRRLRWRSFFHRHVILLLVLFMDDEKELSKEDETPSQWIPKLKKSSKSRLITVFNRTSLNLLRVQFHEEKGNWRRKPPAVIRQKSTEQFGVEGKVKTSWKDFVIFLSLAELPSIGNSAKLKKITKSFPILSWYIIRIERYWRKLWIYSRWSRFSYWIYMDKRNWDIVYCSWWITCCTSSEFERKQIISQVLWYHVWNYGRFDGSTQIISVSRRRRL